MRRDISRQDQQKLDEYLNSVHEVEQRIQQAGQRGELQGWRPTLSEPNIPRPKDGYPQDIVEHMRLMSDILVLAFQTDTTRMCSSMLNGHHDATQLPVVMLGGGGRIGGGRNLDYLGKPDRQMCRLYLSMMDKMGVHLEQFGDAKQPLLEV